jgi:hypothetical protein
MMTFGGVPVFEWIGLLLALGLGVEWWLTRRALVRDEPPPTPPQDSTDPEDPVNRA